MANSARLARCACRLGVGSSRAGGAGGGRIFVGVCKPGFAIDTFASSGGEATPFGALGQGGRGYVTNRTRFQTVCRKSRHRTVFFACVTVEKLVHNVPLIVTAVCGFVGR